MQVSSTADCSQLSYVSSRVCGHTNENTRSSKGAGSFAIKSTPDTGGVPYCSCGKFRTGSWSKLFDFFFLNHFMMFKFASLAIFHSKVTLERRGGMEKRRRRGVEELTATTKDSSSSWLTTMWQGSNVSGLCGFQGRRIGCNSESRSQKGLVG
jgi:hypothetical protein